MMEIKVSKRVVVLGVMVVSALAASPSPAATYRFSTTSSSLNATGPTVRLVTASATLTCSGSSAVLSGPAAGTDMGPASTSSWNHLPFAADTAVSVKAQFTSCRVVATAYTVKCNMDEPTPVRGVWLNATSTAATSQFDTLHTTAGTLSSIDCNVYIGNGTTNYCAKITSIGANVVSSADRVGVSVTYRNPTGITAGGTLTVSAASQTLTSSSIDPRTGMTTRCILGDGDARFSNSTGGDVVYAVDASMSIWAL